MDQNSLNSAIESLLSSLNPSQREAVTYTEGPLLMLAGAGTGKTKALTSRIAYILMNHLASPGQILAVTFTNKASREMEHRIQQQVGDHTNGMWLGTFHSIAVRILRRYGDLLGFNQQFTIIDTDDQERVMRQVLQALYPNLDDKKYSAKSVLQVIQRLKDKGLLPKDLTKHDSLLGKGHWDPAAVYDQYQQRLLQLNAMDFGDLLLFNLKLFSDFPDVLRGYQHQFKYILVDEYQDTNVTQYLWLRLLAQHHKNVCCVGDDDQSIYGWRGAEVGNILKFEKDFPGAQIIRLEDNYRSTPHILGAASGLISKNDERLGKTLRTTIREGEKVQVIKVWDDQQEAQLVGSTIQDLFKEGFKPSQCAVLVRASSQTRSFEDQFTRLGVAYRVVGGFKFYERLEVRDVLAYMRLLAQPSDDLAFERIINTPKRGIGDSTLEQIYQASQALGVPLLAATRHLVENQQLPARVQKTLQQFTDWFKDWSTLLETTHFSVVVKQLLDDTGYLKMWEEHPESDALQRVDNIQELLRSLQNYATLYSFLEYVSLATDSDKMDEQEQVTVMTLHAAKGLEFDVVFLPGWEQGLFPNQRAINDSGKQAIEEERRLAYVGITRAKKRAYIYYCMRRRLFGHWSSALPSVFIDDLPTNHVIHKDTTRSNNSRSTAWSPQFIDDDIPDFTASQRTYRPAQPSRPQGSFGKGVDDFLKSIPPSPSSKSSLPPSKTQSPEWRKGERAQHPIFGKGTVVQVLDSNLDIRFDRGGVKTIVKDKVIKTQETV